MKNIDNFLDTLIAQIKDVGIDVTGLNIDHIAFSTSNSAEYEEKLAAFLNDGELVKEAIISDRRVAIIKLNTPYFYRDYNFNVVEVIEPVAGESAMSGWEHAEFLVDSYDDILKKYPHLDWNINHKNREHFSRIKLTLPNGLEVKFLDTPVLVSAEEEKQA